MGMSDMLLTVRDVAAVLQCSEDAVIRRFAKVHGVIDLGSSETRKKRRYRVLRVPKAVVEKYLSTKAGHPVRIEVPTKPERRRRSDSWEHRATLNLAKAGRQNECRDKCVYQRIARRARVLAALVQDESLWAEVCWLDEEDEL
jgi:hypothetical protein